MAQHEASIGSPSRVHWDHPVIRYNISGNEQTMCRIDVTVASPANTKHLYNICTMLDQRRRRWADLVQMLYKWFVFAR